ncbi:MAG: site-specific integrase [Gammaproteobacteria bacterium]|nr:site-specific integrase [Gammaproteobacteria bacterium]
MDCSISITLDGLFDLYKCDAVLRPATVHHFSFVVGLFSRTVGAIPFTEITRDMILTFRDQVLARAQPSTWNNYLRHLRTIGSFAVRMEYAKDNPFMQIKPAPVSHKRKKTIDDKLLRQAFTVLDDTGGSGNKDPLQPKWFWNIVMKVLYSTGIRRRQLVEIRWRHVDLEQGTLLLVAEGSKTRREWWIPLMPEVIADLKYLHKRTLELQAPDDITNMQVFNVTLFYDRYSGDAMTEEQLSGFFRRLSSVLGQRITPHRFRHTLATKLLQGTHPDIKTVQKLLGHTDMRMTLEYVEIGLDDLRALLHARLGDFL